MFSRPIGEPLVVRVLVALAAVFLVVSLFFRPTPFASRTGTFATGATVTRAPKIDLARRPEDAKTYALDVLVSGTKRIPLREAPRPILVPAGSTLTVSGWAVDPQTLAKARSLTVTLDDASPQIVTGYGIDRADVANVLQSDGARTSGFTASIPLRSTMRGRHTIRFAVRASSGANFAFPTDIAIEIGTTPPVR